MKIINRTLIFIWAAIEISLISYAIISTSFPQEYTHDFSESLEPVLPYLTFGRAHIIARLNGLGDGINILTIQALTGFQAVFGILIVSAITITIATDAKIRAKYRRITPQKQVTPTEQADQFWSRFKAVAICVSLALVSLFIMADGVFLGNATHVSNVRDLIRWIVTFTFSPFFILLSSLMLWVR